MFVSVHHQHQPKYVPWLGTRNTGEPAQCRSDFVSYNQQSIIIFNKLIIIVYRPYISWSYEPDIINECLEYLVVDESPLFKKSVHAHNCANVAGEVAAACCARQVLRRIQAICVNHEVPVPSVNAILLYHIIKYQTIITNNFVTYYVNYQ